MPRKGMLANEPENYDSGTCRSPAPRALIGCADETIVLRCSSGEDSNSGAQLWETRRQTTEKLNNAGDGQERRKHGRYTCEGFAEVILEEAAFLFRGTIRDLSLTGCYVQSTARLKLNAGTMVELKFSLNSDQLLLPAQIVAVRPGFGAGFEFLDIDREMRNRLARLIFKLANPMPDEQALAASNPAVSGAAASEARDLWR